MSRRAVRQSWVPRSTWCPQHKQVRSAHIQYTHSLAQSVRGSKPVSEIQSAVYRAVLNDWMKHTTEGGSDVDKIATVFRVQILN